MTDVFTLTEEHLRLLSLAQVRWDSSPQAGAPAIDPVAPYGGVGALSAVASTLGIEGEIKPVRLGGDRLDYQLVLPEHEMRRCWQVHRETEYALQIVLQFQAFEPGRYTRIGGRWERLP